MGEIITITCRNKGCGHHMEFHVGEGFSLFRKSRLLEDELKSDRNSDDIILELLDKGSHINYRAVYVCPHCREWIEYDNPYIFDPIRVTPLGIVREYKLRYLRGNPICEKCGSDLYHIFNPLSTNNPCPKCGADNMNAIKVGSFD